MPPALRSLLFPFALLSGVVFACATPAEPGALPRRADTGAGDGAASPELDAAAELDTGVSGCGGGVNGVPDTSIDAAPPADAGRDDAPCASVIERVAPARLPVDIVWIVDNSVSMKPAIDELTRGLNAFAGLIADRGLDYRVIMLSLRRPEPETIVLGSPRYAVCVPPPLAGDDQCRNGPRFFQSSIDIRSRQPLEQFLGTLGQTTGYRQGDERGGEPWHPWLRPDATRSVVIVSDDDSRFGAEDFEHFAGGRNPFNDTELPPGVLEPAWQNLFDGYVFNGIYGWGSEHDPAVRCQYPSGALAASSGATYTELVRRTGGVRAKICDGAAAWTPFFDAVAQAALQRAELACEIAIPAPRGDAIDPSRVNVTLRSESSAVELSKVRGSADCGVLGGWYYDNDIVPARVSLCPASCDELRVQAERGTVSFEVSFGCASVVH